MRKIFIFTCLLSFMLSCVPYAHAQFDFGDEGFTEGFEDGGFSEGSSESLDSIIDDLDSIHSDLEDEVEDFPSKPLKQVNKKLDKCIGLLEDAQEASEEEEIEDCGESLVRAGNLFEKIVDTFESRQCKSERASRKCIALDVVDTYLEDLEELLDSLDEEINLDDDEDGIPDICGFSEDFE